MTTEGAPGRPSAAETLESLSPALLLYFLRRVDEPQDAADLLAETLIVLWRRRGKLPTAEGEARMWAYTVAGKVLQNSRRSSVRYQALAVRLRSQLQAITHDHGPAVDTRIDVQNALAGLPPDDAELVRLVHWEGLTIKQAGELLGVGESTARSRYASVRQRLRVVLTSTATP